MLWPSFSPAGAAAARSRTSPVEVSISSRAKAAALERASGTALMSAPRTLFCTEDAEYALHACAARAVFTAATTCRSSTAPMGSPPTSTRHAASSKRASVGRLGRFASGASRGTHLRNVSTAARRSAARAAGGTTCPPLGIPPAATRGTGLVSERREHPRCIAMASPASHGTAFIRRVRDARCRRCARWKTQTHRNAAAARAWAPNPDASSIGRGGGVMRTLLTGCGGCAPPRSCVLGRWR